MSAHLLEMADDQTPVRIRDFHGVCGARIFTGWAAGEQRARYYASDALNAAEIARCPVCGEPLVVTERYQQESWDHACTRHRTTMLTAFEMERRYLAARERLCAGAPLDAEAIVCMSAELDDIYGLTLEEIAPLYGYPDAETLRNEIAFFTATTTTNNPPP